MQAPADGRVAALEILISNAAVAANIREGKTHQIPSAMQMGGKLGMKLLNDALMDLVRPGLVDPSEAYLKCIAKDDFLRKCQAEGFQVNLPSADLDDSPHASAPAAAAHSRPAPQPSHGRPNAGADTGPRGPLPQRGAPAPMPQRTPSPTPSSTAPGAGGASFFDKFKKP